MDVCATVVAINALFLEEKLDWQICWEQKKDILQILQRGSDEMLPLDRWQSILLHLRKSFACFCAQLRWCKSKSKATHVFHAIKCINSECSMPRFYNLNLFTWPLNLACLHKRRCQIKVQFESGAKTKFLLALFQPMTPISHHQSVPWSHSFQNMYNTHICKMYLDIEKWGFSNKIFIISMKNCKNKLVCFTLVHFFSTFMNTKHKVLYINVKVLI